MSRRLGVLAVALFACREEPKSNPPPVGRSWKTPPAEAADGGVAAQRFPRVVYRGGRFLKNPRVVTITFAGEDPGLTARLEAFGDSVTGSAWWREVVDSYCTQPTDCIGEGRPGPHVHLVDKLPGAVAESDVDDVLKRALDSGKLGPADPDLLLVAYLPKAVTLQGRAGRAYCAGGPRAFHRALGDAKVAYAVVPRCGDEPELTATASHEILEATTNPDPSDRGFSFEGGSSMLGFIAAGLEPVDPCGLVTMDGHRTFEGGFVFQRAWSNRAAALGRDPCVPSRSDRPYLAAVPRMPTVRLEKEGMSATITLDAYSDRPTPNWAVSAFDLSGYQQGAALVDASLDKTVVHAGDTLTLTLTSRRTDPGAATIAVVSTLGVISHMWPIAVVLQ